MYRDSSEGAFERKAFTVKARAEELDPAASGYGKLKTIARGVVDLSAFASIESLTSDASAGGGGGELVTIALDATTPAKGGGTAVREGATATVRVVATWVKNYALENDQGSYASSAGLTTVPGESSANSDVVSFGAAAREEQDLSGFDSDVGATSEKTESTAGASFRKFPEAFGGRSQLLSPVKEASPSKERGTPIGTPAKPSRLEIRDDDDVATAVSAADTAVSPSSPAPSSTASTPSKRRMLNRTPVKTKGQAMWGNLRSRVKAARTASALSGKSAKESIAAAFSKMDEELSLSLRGGSSSEGGGALDNVEWATFGTALGVASTVTKTVTTSDERYEASSVTREAVAKLGSPAANVLNLGARRVSESTAHGVDVARELELTRVRLAAAEERARAAERAADELRRRTTPTTTSTTIIRGLSEVVATGASTGEGEGDGDGDGDTPMSDGTHARFFTPAASTDPTPSATPKGADPSKDYSSFAALIVETDGRKARGDAGEGEAAALADVKDASFGGRRLYDADQADDAIARLRAEMDDRAGLIERLQDALRQMVDKMASLKSEKDEVESVADSLSEKNVQLQSHIDRVVISRVVSLMRNVSVARAFRTWREWVQAEKIERAEKATHDAAAEKTAALVRASNDEFRLATLKDEVEELRAQLAALTARAETAEAKAATAEAKAATAEKWAAEAESKAFDAVSKAKDAEKRTNTPPAAAAAADSEAVKAAEIRAAEAESRALESLAKAADAEAEAAEAEAQKADAEERVVALERRMDAVREEANAVEVAAAKVVAEARTDAEDARALLDSARATAEAAEAARAAEIRELEARLAETAGQSKATETESSNRIRELEARLAKTTGESKAAETELSNQSALIERLGDEVRRWRDAKAEADVRATNAESEVQRLRSSIAKGDERFAKQPPSSPRGAIATRRRRCLRRRRRRRGAPLVGAIAACRRRRRRRGAPLVAHRLLGLFVVLRRLAFQRTKGRGPGIGRGCFRLCLVVVPRARPASRRGHRRTGRAACQARVASNGERRGGGLASRAARRRGAFVGADDGQGGGTRRGES